MKTEITEGFIEQMGLSVQADGLPRIAGRMFGYFVIQGGTHSFSELAEKLQVSRGSISTNARLLESLGILERTAHPGDRQDYFRLSEDPYGRLLKGYLSRMQRNKDLVTKTRGQIPAKEKVTHSRLREMEGFYEMAMSNTVAILNAWSTSRKKA